MKHLAFILTILLLTSCITQQKCNRRYPPQIIHDSIRIIKTNTVWKDTTIYLYIKGDTVRLSDTVFIKDGKVIAKPIESSLKWSYAKAYIQNNRLRLIHYDRDTIINNIIKNAIREKTTTDTIKVNTVTIKEVPFIPWWAKLLMWLSLPTIVFVFYKLIRIFVFS